MAKTNDLVVTVPQTIEDDRVVNEAVQRRLNLCDELETTVKELTEKIQYQAEQLGGLNKENNRLKLLEVRDEELVERKIALDARERELNLRQELNELKISSANQRVIDHVSMVNMVFRSPSMRRTVQGDIAIPMAADHNGIVHYRNTKPTTTTIDETID